MVVMCHGEKNDRLYPVTVYMLLDEFKAYGLMIVVQGTPRNICGSKQQTGELTAVSIEFWKLAKVLWKIQKEQ